MAQQYPPRPTYPSPATSQPPPTSALAVTALVCGVLGWTILPIVAGLPAAGLGSAALVVIRRRSGALGGRGLALSALVLGLLGGIIPTAILLVILGIREGGAPALLAAVTIGYGLAVLVTAGYGLAGTSEGHRSAVAAAVGATAGGLVALAVGLLAVVGMGLLFWFLARELIDQTISAVGDAIHDAVTGKK